MDLYLIIYICAPQNCFELFIPDNKDQVIKACKTEADGRVVEGNHTFYRISAPTTEEKDEWMNSIKWVDTSVGTLITDNKGLMKLV